MRPANHQQAAQQMHALLIRKLPGRRKTAVDEHLKRAKRIAVILWKQYQVGPYQLKVSHLQWYLDVYIQDLKPSTQYRHKLTIQRILRALGKYEAWYHYLT